LREGLRVGAALQRSWLPRGAVEAQRVAAFAVGAALPVVAWQVLQHPSPGEVGATVGVALVGVVLSVVPRTRVRVSGLRFGLLLVGVALLALGGLR
jgi:hypothetical protein